MPRNIDPKVSQIANVQLYHIDELEDVVQANMRRRRKAIKEVEKIIDDKLIEFHSKLRKCDGVSSGNLSQPLETI